MGWILGDPRANDHEGYLLAVEERAGTWRERGYPDDDQPDEVRVVQVGCACGWRAPREAAPLGTRWEPFVVRASKALEERALARWTAHVDHELAALETERVPAPDEPSELRLRADGAAPGPLVLGIDAGGRRHFLAGRAVHAGAALELRTAAGGWIAGRYEWSFELADPPRLCGAIVGVEIPLSPVALLRWPSA